MVTKVFKVVYKEIRGLHEAAYILAAFTLASQFLALFRDRLLAHQFGAGTELDLYYTAFRIPDLLFVVFASVLSVYVLIPFVTEARGEGGEAAAESLLSQVFTIFLFGYSLFALIIALFAYQLVALLFPGFTQSEYPQLVLLLRILLLRPFFLSISNLFGVVTQLSNRFVLYALSPILYNIGIIIGILLLYPRYGLAGLGLGVVLGAVTSLVMAFVLVHAVKYAGAKSIPEGMMVGFFNWLGFIATVQLGAVLWAKQSMKLYAITVGAELVSLLLMGGLLAAWP